MSCAESRLESVVTAAEMSSAAASLPAALPTPALLVYVAEQLLEAVLREESSPCLAFLFAQQCLLTND